MKLTLEQFETQFADNNLSVTDWFDTTYGLFKELEALQSRSCDGCKYFRNSDKACFMSSHNTYDRPASIKFSGCGKFKPKEQ